MATKTVPVPSVGRIVLYAVTPQPMMIEAWKPYKPTVPAVVVWVDPKDPRKVHLIPLAVCGSWVGRYEGVDGHVVESTYGEGKDKGWWWPPRVEATMEVES